MSHNLIILFRLCKPRDPQQVAAVYARFVGPHREGIVSLMQTDTLPTAFTVNAEPETVVKAVQKLNPGCSVVWEGVK